MTNHAGRNVIQVLEQAAEAGRPLLLDLRDGRRVSDGVCELLRSCGEDVAILHANNRVAVADIIHAEFITEDDPEMSGAIWSGV